jgi:ceramide kinase
MVAAIVVRLCDEAGDEGSGGGLSLALDPKSGVSWSFSGRPKRRGRAAWPPPPPLGSDGHVGGGHVGWPLVLSVRHVPPLGGGPAAPLLAHADGRRAQGSAGLEAPLNPGGGDDDVEAPPLAVVPPPSGVHPEADWLPPAAPRPPPWGAPHLHLHTVVVCFAQAEVRAGGSSGGGAGGLLGWWRRRRRWRPRGQQDGDDDDGDDEDDRGRRSAARAEATRLRARALVARTSDGAAAAAAAALAADAAAPLGRPRRLLVLVNPSSGARAAARVWRRAVEPVLQLLPPLEGEGGGADAASLRPRYDALRTRARGEAERRCAEAAAAAAAAAASGAPYDGALAVGGDGLFQELLAGALQLSSAPSPSAEEGEEEEEEAAGRSATAETQAPPFLRLGHVPAGSTDAAAFTLHGGRDAETAALAAALGLGGRMDVGLLRALPPPASAAAPAPAPAPPPAVPFCCMASSGFLGDVLSASERLPRRLLGGGLRYDLAGAWALLRLRARAAEIEYLPAAAAGDDGGGGEEEEEEEGRWVPLVPPPPPGQPPRRRRRPRAQGFSSIKVAATACRSGRSRRGVAPGLAPDDGRLLVAAVSGASRRRFLRYLLRLAARGLAAAEQEEEEAAEEGGGVAVVHASAVRVRGGWGRPWNVDGELVRPPPDGGSVEVRVRRGAVRVFSAVEHLKR